MNDIIEELERLTKALEIIAKEIHEQNDLLEEYVCEEHPVLKPYLRNVYVRGKSYYDRDVYRNAREREEPTLRE